MKKIFFLAFTAAMFLTSCSSVKNVKNSPAPITVKDGIFYRGSESYYFVGANYWYGPLIAARNIGDRERLIKELDLMKSKGIDNLRILVGAEGGTQDFQVKPALQPEQGEYNEDLLDGLDFLLAEMAKRDMYAVLYLNNNWIWSGGMSAYLEWNGYGEVANPFSGEIFMGRLFSVYAAVPHLYTLSGSFYGSHKIYNWQDQSVHGPTIHR